MGQNETFLGADWFRLKRALDWLLDAGLVTRVTGEHSKHYFTAKEGMWEKIVAEMQGYL
jgi:hypothetical protein